MLRLLGEFGADPEVLDAARNLAKRYLSAPDSVDTDLAREALRVTALNDDGGLYDAYIEAYRKADMPSQKSTILASIYFRDPDIVRRHLDFSISSEVPAGDSTTAMELFPAFLEDHSILYAWLEDNLDAYEEKMPSVRHVSLPQRLVGTCTEENLAMLRDFFADRDEKYATSFARAVESVEICIAARQREAAAVDKFLATNAG